MVMLTTIHREAGRCLSSGNHQIEAILPIMWYQFGLYSHDALPAEVLAIALCLSMSVTSRCYIEMDGQIELGVFWHERFFRPILEFVIRKFNSCINRKGTSL